MTGFITILDTIALQREGESVRAVDNGFNYPILSSEEPYHRTLTATKEWQKLDCGWVNEASMLYVENKAGTNLLVNPTEDENATMAAQVLELSCNVLVYPGQTARFTPRDLAEIKIRSLGADCKYVVTVYPR